MNIKIHPSKYKQIDGRWPNPSLYGFAKYHTGVANFPFLEDIYWWWRHLPEHLKYP